MSDLPVLVMRLHPDVGLPTYAYPGDAGADLVTTEAAELAPGERTVLPTGIAIALPEGYAAFVHPRSDLLPAAGSPWSTPRARSMRGTVERSR